MTHYCEETSIVFEFDGAVDTVDPVMEVEVAIENGANKGPAPLAKILFVFHIDYSLHPPPPVPLCYRGVVVNRTKVNPGTCQCEPGASGLACEFRSCPNNCNADAAFPKGMCDRFAGECRCSPG